MGKGVASVNLSILLLVVAASGLRAEEARVFNWSDYIDETLLKKFDYETGIAVVYDVFESNEMLEAELVAGNSGYVTALANGEICVAMGWSGDVLQATARAREAGEGVEIRYSAFREGSLVWFDQLAIPADAPNPDGAHAFLNFMLEPEKIAAVSNYVQYANENLSSREFLDADMIGNAAIYPAIETLRGLRVSEKWEAETVRRAKRLWTKTKSGT